MPEIFTKVRISNLPGKYNAMNKNIIKEELQWLLEAINEQFEAIKEYDDKIPKIEFDIMMENVRKLYENMYILQRLNDPVSAMEKRQKQKEPDPDPVPLVRPVVKEEEMPSEPAIPEITVRIENSVTEPPEPQPGLSQEDPPQAEIIKGIIPEKMSVKAESPRSSFSRKISKPDDMDLFAEEEPTFSIKLKEAREKALGPKPESAASGHLKTMISINEKFMFINELFEGNLREYNETIETLNGFNEAAAALDFLDLTRKKNLWDSGSNAFKKLHELVERRF